MKKLATNLKSLALVVTTLMTSTSILADASQKTESDFKLDIPVVEGEFKPTDQSLKNYKTPEWFKNAKFGIWSHWGPQAVPRYGDWYARLMYIPGTSQYKHHLENYGHPSENGFKDIIELWKAEKFDPEALMKLYAKAGARYFVSMGVHHDNFDLWNSKHHAWNAVEKGPKRDIVGDWKAAAEKYGLRFGVSEHLGASYSWYMPSHGYDEFWPKFGVDYDGADPAYSELYHSGKDRPYRGHETWYTDYLPSQQNWFNRISDLLEQYQPDLLYTDGGLPFGAVGRTLVTNYYNNNITQHKGNLNAVYTYKNIGSGEFIPGIGVQDVERGVMQGINEQPWQTDTSIGDWYYSEHHAYKPTSQVVHMLADIVSKNGNLLLNVVQYPDGSLPPEAERFLHEMGEWMAVNDEAIYDTRPWVIFGEGPTEAATGHFNEEDNYTAEDIRFTNKDDILYAITLDTPVKQVKIKALGLNSEHIKHKVKSVTLLGYQGKLDWKQQDDALIIQVPSQLPSLYSSSFKIVL
jgi:alpha-L-fucosidase